MSTPNKFYALLESTTPDPQRLEEINKKPLSEINYLICFTPRSGSTLLTEILSATGVMGYPEEYFNSNSDADTPISLSLILKNELGEKEGIPCNNISDYINSIRREYSTSNGVFGYEATFFQLQQVLERSSLFSLFGDNLLFISLTRKDFISQAISLYKAVKTGFFHSIKHKIEDFIQKDQKIEYNREEIKQWVIHILQQEYGNEKLFKSMGVEPLRLTYEKLVADTLGCVKEIATYIGVILPDSFSISKTRNEKVGTSLNQQFKERFMAEEEHFVRLCHELRGTVPAHLIEKEAEKLPKQITNGRKSEAMNITPNMSDKSSEQYTCPINLENLKILIIATPKTGNTWLKLLLSHVYDLPVVEELPMDIVELKRRVSTLGNQWIAHQHYPSPQFELVDYLAKENIVLLTTIRHPGDVLVSLFHFVKWYSFLSKDDPLSYVKNDDGVMGKYTQKYLQDNNFAGLLQISLHWMPHVIGWVRYEDMLANPLDCLVELTNAISPVSRETIVQAVVACEIKNLRIDGRLNKEFFRKGSQGEWKESIPPEILQILRNQPPYPELCNQLGYSFDDTGVSTLPAFDYTTINPFYQRQEFDNGVKITQLLSRVYFSTKNAWQRWPNPFETSSEECFYNWLNLPSEAEMRNSSDNSLKELLISNLAYFIYQIRGDLRQAFPDLFGKNRVEFCQWFVNQAPLEYEIDEVFITLMSLSLNHCQNTKGQKPETIENSKLIISSARIVSSDNNEFTIGSNVLQLPKKVKPPYSWVEHIPFAFFLVHTLKPKMLVELGVYVGNSYNAFCQAVSLLKTGTQCYGIDTWRGDEHSNFYDESVYNELFAYQQREYQGFSSLLRMTFDEARNRFTDGTIDLLHIDGFHTYDAVKHDFENWLPKVSSQGVIIFHDTEVRDNDFGVWRLWQDLAQTYPSFNFKHGYGLGVIAVGTQVPQEFLNFLQAANQEPFSRELFARLGHYIALLEKNKAPEKLVSSSSPSHLFAQLFIDTGKGFQEKHSIIKTVTGEESQLEFDLSKYQGIQGLRFDPLNELVHVEIQQITVRDDLGIVHPEANYKTNASIQRENHFWFDHRDPNLVINWQHLSKPQQITIRLKYLTIGNDTYRAIWETQKEILATTAPVNQSPEPPVQPLEPPGPRYFAQLFVDTGAGFSEKQSIIQMVTNHSEEQVFEFDLSGYENLKRLRFDPLNALIALQIKQIEVVDAQGRSEQLNYQPVNAYAQLGQVLIFDTEDSQVLIPWSNLEKPQKILIRLQYVAVGTGIYRVFLQGQLEVIQQQAEQIRSLAQLVPQAVERVIPNIVTV